MARRVRKTATSAKRHTAKKRKAKKQARGPLFDEVDFAGVGLIQRKGRKRVLVIYTSREEAIRHGQSKEVASQLFAGVAAGGGLCRENWGWFSWKIKCENSGCAGECLVQLNRLDDNGWDDVGGDSAVVDPNWVYRCRCSALSG